MAGAVPRREAEEEEEEEEWEVVRRPVDGPGGSGQPPERMQVTTHGRRWGWVKGRAGYCVLGWAGADGDRAWVYLGYRWWEFLAVACGSRLHGWAGARARRKSAFGTGRARGSEDSLTWRC